MNTLIENITCAVLIFQILLIFLLRILFTAEEYGYYLLYLFAQLINIFFSHLQNNTTQFSAWLSPYIFVCIDSFVSILMAILYLAFYIRVIPLAEKLPSVYKLSLKIQRLIFYYLFIHILLCFAGLGFIGIIVFFLLLAFDLFLVIISIRTMYKNAESYMIILLVAGVFIAIIGIIVSIMYYMFDSAEADIISVYYIFLPGTIIETSLFTAGLIYKAYSSIGIKNKLELEKFELEKINRFHQKQVIQNELKALRAQINPHFIQNTFDLIAQRIRENDKEESVKIIREVSAYFRQILLKSETSMVSLEDEVEYTENYLKIQQLVHAGLFSYKIHMPESVDSFGIQVPAMLLQPIAENCIKHGFKNIRKGGKIMIDIEEKEGILKIVFTDNGGVLTSIKPAEEFSESKVVVLTKKRINLMLENNHEKVSVRLYSEEGNTIFEIQYPCVF